MADVAAGAWVAAEVVEHTAEAGYAAYLVTKPTLPLKVTFTRMATAKGDDSEHVIRYPVPQSQTDHQTLLGPLQPHCHSNRQQGLHFRW